MVQKRVEHVNLGVHVKSAINGMYVHIVKGQTRHWAKDAALSTAA